MLSALRCSVFTLAITFLSLPLSAQEEEAPTFNLGNQIQHISGDLWRAGNGLWHSIFLVTDAGILLVDPLNPAYAAWLHDELAERFDVPVRYVVYSHSHWDHVEGGEVFADTAQFVAHERMLENMDGRYPHMPGDMVDRNDNGLVDYDDIMIPTNADPGICGMSEDWFHQMDADGDGVMTPTELQVNIVRPEITYSERMTLTLGGRTVELMHPGSNHGNDMTVVYFPEEKVVFATDMMADALVREDIRSLPSACGALDHTPIDEWIASYEALLEIPFETFAGGHGGFFGHEEMELPLQFLLDLRTEVDAALAEGLTLEEMKEQILLEEYADWAYYERLREKNIEAAYLNMTRLKW